jgi:Protein of unknown function (DUF3309)
MVNVVGLIIIIILVLFMLGTFPSQGGYSEGFGYAPSGLLGLIIIIVLILFLLGLI